MPDKDKEQTQNLLVAVRVRPLSGVEMQDKGETEVVHVLDNKLVVLRDPNEDQDDILRANRSRERQYIFDVAFGPNATQEEVYQKTSKPLIKNVITGYNTSVFAYGATGAGKTYTMLGTDREPGIMGRALNDLFSEMEGTKEEMAYRVSMSYLEIYNEMIKDLLNPSSGVLELREDSKGAAVVAGISEVEARTTSEVMSMLMMGNKQRTCEPTAANLTSSRSHAILQVTVEQRSRVKNVMQEFRVGKLFMVDLAGSERASQTKNRGKRMIEGAHINRSLLALGNCINALSENRGHYVNYRDSKLTRLLKDSLGGNCLTVMITHVSPSGSSFEETRNTLLYADRAKNIKTKVKQNQFNVSYHIAQYTSIIADLRKEVFRLKMKIADHEVSVKSNATGKNAIQKEDQEEMDRLRNQLVSTFREQMDIRRKLIELEDAAMQIALDTNRHMLTIDQWEQEKARRKARLATDASATDATANDVDTTSSINTETVTTNDTDQSADADEDTSRPHGKLVKAESVEDVDQKDLDTEKHELEGADDSLLEPEEVTFAREEISTLITEEKRMSEVKVDLQSKLQQTRQEVEHLEELLPKRISSGENREILGLLCKVHELEITNAELQSQSLLRENLLRHKDLEMYKYETRQRLCDEIIQLQRKVMEDASVSWPSEVEALYDVYRQQIAEIEERDAMLLAREDTQTSLAGSTGSVQSRASVLAGLNRRLTAPKDTLFPFSSKLSPLSEETPSRLTSLQNSPVKMSRPTPSSQNLFPEESLDIPPALPSPKRTNREDTPNNDYSPTPQNLDLEDQPTKADFPPTPVFSRTRKIVDIAARRRGLVGEDKSVSSSRTSLRIDDGATSKAASLGPAEEAQSEPSPKLAGKFLRPDAKRTTVKASLSMSDLSVIDKKNGDASSEESVPVGPRKPIIRKHKPAAKKAAVAVAVAAGRPTRRLRSASLDETKMNKVKPRRTRKEELRELARLKAAESAAAAQQPYSSRFRDRAALGLEGKGAKRLKRSSIHKPSAVRATDVPRLPGPSKVLGLHSGFASATPDGELRRFSSNPTPPSTVHQSGVPIGKGHTIQKRYRGTSDNLGSNSNQSTPRLKPKRNSLPPPRGVDELSVSGVAFRPSLHSRKS